MKLTFRANLPSFAIIKTESVNLQCSRALASSGRSLLLPDSTSTNLAITFPLKALIACFCAARPKPSTPSFVVEDLKYAT